MTVQKKQAITDKGRTYTRDLKAAIESDAQLAAQTLEAAAHPCEWKIVPLRECPAPDDARRCDTPVGAANYWRAHVVNHPFYNPECECAAILLLDSRRQVKGHCLIAIGTIDAVLVHPREAFRAAVIASASAIILVHNHPSGDPSPSEDDIKVSRALRRAGQVLKIDLLDSIIIGADNHYSLLSFGYLELEQDQHARLRAHLHLKFGPQEKWPDVYASLRQRIAA